MVSDGTSCLATTNPPCSNVFTLVYTTPGTYTLNVIHQGSGSDDITITVDPNIQPDFDIYTCAGAKVDVNITDKNYDKYFIDFNNDGSVDTAIPSGNTQTASHAYGVVGNYNISIHGQKLNAADNCAAKVQGFTALNNLPIPSVKSLTAVDAGTLQLDYTPQTNIEYHSEIGYNNSTNFQLFQVLYDTTSMVAKGLLVDDNYYCFRLGSFDPCANTNVYAPPICSHNFKLNLVSGTDELSWQTASTGISTIDIERNNAKLTSVSATATTYNDNAIICKTDYTYQLISNYASGAKSYSLEKTGTAFLTQTPAGINNTSAVVGSAQVDLSWLTDPAYTISGYDIFRKPTGGAYSLQGKSNIQKFTDSTYNETGLCYQINYTDNCGNASATGMPACPIILNGAVGQLNEINLQWSAYIGWDQGVKYYSVQKYFQPGQAGTTIYTGLDSTFVDSLSDPVNQIVYYKIIAQAMEAGVPVSISNEIKVERHVNLYYPTAFNPDSKSALNRTFSVKGFYIAKMELQVFDRWGSLVFFTDNNTAWDGRRDGTQMPDATYVWTAEITDLVGNTFKKAGTVVLIHK